MSDSQAAKVFERARGSWGEEIFRSEVRERVGEYRAEKREEIVELTVTSHRGIHEDLVEIGRLQYYYLEMEFLLPLEKENKKIDVVWKRELMGVPTFAFEVEMSGGIEKAIIKLRLAFNKWNSQARLIIPGSEYKSAASLVTHEQHAFQKNFRYYYPGIIKGLLVKKRDLRSFEKEHGIY